MVQTDNINFSILRGIQYLKTHQLHNGQFCSYSALDESMEKFCRPDLNVFTTSIIGGALLSLKELQNVSDILNKMKGFIEGEMSPEGLWPHFSSGSHLHIYSCLDLDDSACASAFLAEWGNHWIRERNVNLMLGNRNNKGLYYTWFLFRFRFVWNYRYMKTIAKTFLQPKKYQLIFATEANINDIDAVVNANFLYYLGERAETRKIIEMIIGVIQNNSELSCDKWYKNIFSIYYFFSKCCYKGIRRLNSIKKPIRERVLAIQNPDGSFGNSSLDTAMAISSLLNVGYNGPGIKLAINHLLNTQKEEGHWQRYGFYFGGHKKLQCYGSEELSTAFCLEALYRYQQYNEQNKNEMEAL